MRNSPEAWDEQATLPTPWEAALWSQHGQEVRFQAILRHLPLARGDVVLDYGCGTGALASLLPGDVFYVGWDWSAKMRERARAEHPSVTILDHAPRLERYEHVVCCGTFNLAADWTHEQTWNIVRQLWRKQVTVSLALSLYRGRDAYCLRYGLDEVSDFLWRESIVHYLVDTTYATNDLLLVLRK